jgi:hypothetical protein
MLFSAHRIEAQAPPYSQPVRVLNTSAAPVLASLIDDPGRTPYQSLSRVFAQSGFASFSFGVVPANHRLVVQHISGNFLVVPNGPPLSISMLEPNGFIVSSFFVPTFGSITAFDQPSAIVSGNLLSNIGAQTLTITGYLVDCSAAPCAAITQ